MAREPLGPPAADLRFASTVGLQLGSFCVFSFLAYIVACQFGLGLFCIFLYLSIREGRRGFLGEKLCKSLFYMELSVFVSKVYKMRFLGFFGIFL